MLTFARIIKDKFSLKNLFQRFVKREIYTTDTHLRSTTNSIFANLHYQQRLLQFLGCCIFSNEICKFSSTKKKEKEKEYHRSFLKATKRERKSGPALPNRAEPRCLPTMVARSTCIMLAEK